MDQATLIEQQDTMRPWRMFVGAVNGLVSVNNDNMVSTTDSRTGNQAYGFQVGGPNGFSVEGSGISIRSGNQATAISPMVILLALGALIVFK